MSCTALDHSDYKLGTNHWGLERCRDLEVCEKCGLPTFDRWFRNIEWTNKDRAYWKRIFREASERRAFIVKNFPRGESWSPTYVELDPDREVTPEKVLLPSLPKWARTDLAKTILQHRYDERRPKTKNNDYGVLTRIIYDELEFLIQQEDLEYVDNRRIAEVGNRADMRRYEDQRASGCCGSFDREITVGGRRFMVGCNYGH